MRAKLITLILAVILITGCLNASAFTDVTDGKNKKAIETISALGLIKGYEDGSFKPSQPVSRAEFAAIIASVVKIGQSSEAAEWYSEFFGSEETEMSLKSPTDSEAGRFEDLPSDHWAYGTIMDLVDFGLMNGTQPNLFEPDRAVSYNEGVKTMTKLLGYDVKAELKGGYPNGYLATASSLGMLTGVPQKDDGVLIREDVARLIYNSLDIELLQCLSYGETKSYEPVKDETLLTKVLEMDKTEGYMTANETTSLTSASDIGKNKVEVNGEIFEITKASPNAGDYIGRYVELYYKENKDDDLKEIVYITLSDEDECLTIPAERIKGFQNNVFSYYGEDLNKTFSENIIPGAPMIYNGYALSTYDADTFDIQYGNVTLVKTGGKYGLIIVENFTTMYVGAIDKDKFIVYNKSVDANSATMDDSLNLDPDNSDVKIKILSAEGSALDFGNIASGCVLTIAENGNSKKVIINTNTVKIKVSEVTENGSEIYLSDGSKSYKLSRDYIKAAERVPVKAGDNVTLNLDAFGGVAWITLEANADMKTAYLVRYSAVGTLQSSYQFMLFDNTAKPFVLDGADKVAIDGLNGITSTYTSTNMESALNGYKGIIKYSLNSDGKINKIELPLDEEVNRARLYKIFEVTPESNGNISYKSSLMTFGGKIYINSGTVIISQPDDLNDELGYSVLASNYFVNDQFYAVTAYTSIPDSCIAEVIVTKSASKDSVDPRDPVAVVTKVVDSVTPDGEKAKKVVAFQDGKEIELYGEYDRINKAGQSCCSFDMASNPINKNVEYSVVKGDMIRYVKNRSTNSVDNVQVVYKSDLPNPLGKGKSGYLAGVTDKYYIDSNYIVNGKNLMYEKNPAAVLSNGNPYALNGSAVSSPAHRFHMYDVRCMLGYVYSNEKGIIKVTTQDLHQTEYRPSGIPLVPDIIDNGKQYTGVYVIDNYLLSKYKMTYVEYTNDKVIARAGTASDVRSFKESGKSCSKVIVFNRSGEAQQLVIINDLRD